MSDPVRPSGALPLAEALPGRLIAAIRTHLEHRPRDCEDFLTWNAGSAVGYDCLRVAYATQALVFALGDAEDHGGTISTEAIWHAAAHQCAIAAFS